MSKAKINPYKKRVAISLPFQFKAEAHDLNMSPTMFYYWLKQRAGYRTQYDALNDEYESQKSAPQGNAAGEEGE
jgi:hypothetical protein